MEKKNCKRVLKEASLCLQKDSLIANIQKFVYGAYLGYDTNCYNRLMYASLKEILTMYEEYYYNQKSSAVLEEMLKIQLETMSKDAVDVSVSFQKEELIVTVFMGQKDIRYQYVFTMQDGRSLEIDSFSYPAEQKIFSYQICKILLGENFYTLLSQYFLNKTFKETILSPFTFSYLDFIIEMNGKEGKISVFTEKLSDSSISFSGKEVTKHLPSNYFKMDGMLNQKKQKQEYFIETSVSSVLHLMEENEENFFSRFLIPLEELPFCIQKEIQENRKKEDHTSKTDSVLKKIKTLWKREKF